MLKLIFRIDKDGKVAGAIRGSDETVIQFENWVNAEPGRSLVIIDDSDSIDISNPRRLKIKDGVVTYKEKQEQDADDKEDDDNKKSKDKKRKDLAEGAIDKLITGKPLTLKEARFIVNNEVE